MIVVEYVMKILDMLKKLNVEEWFCLLNNVYVIYLKQTSILLSEKC